MVVQHGIKLATNLISAHFGDLVSKVCECLLRNGTLTLGDIQHFTQLKLPQVKNCLLVLIQHNCVQAFDVQKKGGFGAAPKVFTYYMAIFENIIHRLRFAKFIAIVSEELGKECTDVLEGLLQHGRLTLEQIILRAVSTQKEENATVQDTLRENFVKLVNARYVERCPSSVPFIPLPSEDETPSTGRRGAKSAKLTVPETVEQQAMRAAIPSEVERFTVITDTGVDVMSEDNTWAKSNVIAGEKRKREDLENDGIDAAICEKEVLWRANFEGFMRCLRHKACIANVRSRLDNGAGVVLNAMLEATRSSQEKVKVSSTVPLSIDAIFEEVIKSEEGRSMTFEHVRAALGQLGCPPISGEMEDLYSVDIKDIIKIAQTDEVESVVLKKYGELAYRIFRFLSKTGRLSESDKIAADTLGDKKEVLKILYSLWKDGYLQMKKMASAGFQTQSLLLWKVDSSFVKEHILDDMCHAAINLSQRLAYEFEKDHEVVQLLKEGRGGAQGKKGERIRKVKILLVSTLMKLDDVLMLFNDF